MNLKRLFQKQNDEASARDRLAMALELSGIGDWDFDYIKNKSHRSPTHDKIFGYQEHLKDFNFDTFYSHLLPQHREPIEKAFEAAKKSGSLQIETQIRRVDGAVRWISITAKTKFNLFGSPVRILGVTKDITHEKEIEESLKLQRKNLSDLFQFAPEFFCVLNSELRYQWVNPAHIKLFDGKDMTGQKVDEAQPELKGNEIIDILKGILTTQKAVVFNEVMIRIGERDRYLNMLYAPRWNEKGVVDGIFALGSDITDKVVALKLARESENQLRLITDKLPAFVSYSDNQGRYQFLNAKYEHWFKKPISELLGKTREDLTPNDYFVHTKPFQDKVLAGGSTHHESIITNDEGEKMELDIHFVPDIDSDTGLTKGMIAVGMDISQRKKAFREAETARRELHEILMQAPTPMCLLMGKDFVFTMANPLYEEFLDRKVIGKTLNEVFTEDIEMYRKILNHVYHTGETYQIKEAPLELLDRHGNKNLKYMNVGYHAFRDTNGTPIGVFVIIIDVTDQVESVKTRDRFMGIASHELKTPLTVMKLQMQLNEKMFQKDLEKALEPSRLAKVFQLTSSQIDRLTRLVDDMLDLTRINEGKLSMDLHQLNLSTFVKDYIDSFESQIKDAGIDLSYDLDPGILANIDEARIEQVLTNLITNVIKYAPKKPVQISLKQDTDQVVLTVKDHGPGIDSEFQTRLFQRFERASWNKNINGMGLGLYISKNIIENHGGYISVSSRKNEGTEIKIGLPKVSTP